MVGVAFICCTFVAKIKCHIPLRIEKRLQEKKPWMTKKVIKVIKKKYASWKKYTRLRRNKDYQEYVIQRNKTTRICRNARIKI